jgi:hypothetical protein
MKCDEPGCNDPQDHIHLSQDDIREYQAIHNAGKLHAAGAEIERTRAVNIHDHADLLDHLNSDNGHVMGNYAQYRNTHQEQHIPGVRPIDPDYDHELTHRELIALHHHDHNQYDDMPHTTLNGEHFHH